MKKPMSNQMLIFWFAVLTGAFIAGVVWLYLMITNWGITIIWDKIPSLLNIKHYTLIMCLIGGLIVGIFHRAYGPYPEGLSESIKRVMNTGTYPYKHLYITVIAALLSLFFGGAVGPEAGLVCLLLGLCFWAMDQFGMAKEKITAYTDNNPYISRRFMFRQLLRGWFLPADKVVYDKEKSVWSRPQQVGTAVGAGLTGLTTYILLNKCVHSALQIPHLEASEMFAVDYMVVLMLIAVGIGAGYLYLIFKKVTHLFFNKLRGKKLQILNALLGGLVLGIIGTLIPMTMFSGGSNIQLIEYDYLSYTPYMLILIGVVKLFLTNFCIESGWRGGHFFPVIFAGLSIGYGFSVIFDTNQILAVIVVSGALLGTMMQQPIGAVVLSAIFFPIRNLGWIILASCVGGCIPVPPALRADPSKKGFVYGILHRKDHTRLPLFKQ